MNDGDDDKDTRVLRQDLESVIQSWVTYSTFQVALSEVQYLNQVGLRGKLPSLAAPHYLR